MPGPKAGNHSLPRAQPPLLPRLAAAVLLLGSGGALAAGRHGEAASCPLMDYARDLPPLPADPRLVLNADHAALAPGGLSHLSGSVQISRDGRQFSAQQLDYSDINRQVSVNSQSLFRDPSLIIRSDHANFDFNTETGVFDHASYTVVPLSGHGEADRVTIARIGWARLDGVSYTSCAPGSKAWLLSASDIEFDQETGLGRAHNAVLDFQGVPILYLPYFQFPLDGERHTGFLAPVIGDSHNTGFDFRAPFYLNLAPNYDATLIPRAMSKRGEQIGGRFRYLLSSAQGSLLGEYLPDDQVTGTQRSYINFQHEGLINHRLGLEATYAAVSDPNYFEDLGGTIDLSSTSFLTQGAKLTYQGRNAYTIQALVQGYQPIASALVTTDHPYQRLPQIRLDALTANSYLGTRAGLLGEFTDFARSNSVEGERLIAQPYLRWRQDHNAWYTAALGDLSYTYYNLSNTAANQPAQQQRALPVLSGEGGLRFERVTGGGLLQTLEPHLVYLYAPYHNQDRLPLFDSGLPDFDFPELFARNRYTGQDRISDADQLTSAVTTRLIDPASGAVRITASFGEIYRFQAPRVVLPGFDTPSAGGSDYIASAEYQITQRWAATGVAEVTSDLGKFNRGEIELRYREPGAGVYGRRLDIAYRYYRGLLEQTDASFSSPITANWRLAGRLRYSIQDEHTIESFAGLEYRSCCWAARLTYHRYLATSTGGFNNGVYFQIEFKGLSQLGKGFDELLPAYDPNAPIGRNSASVVPY